MRCKVRRSESKWSIFPYSEQRGEKAGRGISYVQVWCVRVLSLDVGAVRGIVDKVSNLFNFLLRLVLDARGYWTLRYDTPRERSAGLGKRWIATTRVSSLCVLHETSTWSTERSIAWKSHLTRFILPVNEREARKKKKWYQVLPSLISN